jgi:hypothetical protein
MEEKNYFELTRQISEFLIISNAKVTGIEAKEILNDYLKKLSPPIRSLLDLFIHVSKFRHSPDYYLWPHGKGKILAFKVAYAEFQKINPQARVVIEIFPIVRFFILDRGNLIDLDRTTTSASSPSVSSPSRVEISYFDLFLLDCMSIIANMEEGLVKGTLIGKVAGIAEKRHEKNYFDTLLSVWRMLNIKDTVQATLYLKLFFRMTSFEERFLFMGIIPHIFQELTGLITDPREFSLEFVGKIEKGEKELLNLRELVSHDTMEFPEIHSRIRKAWVELDLENLSLIYLAFGLLMDDIIDFLPSVRKTPERIKRR